MPMLSFFPWATITEPLRFGRFRLIPTGMVLDQRMVPVEHNPGIAAILEAYDKPRSVDQRSVPILRRDDLTATADLTDDQIAEYFEFRNRLAFAVLSARRFFSIGYSNSDNARLVIQSFVPERAGGALLQHRRRDGATRTIVPPGNLLIRRPHHISGWCELPKDLDTGLLVALEQASESGTDLWGAVEEAIRLFVGANTDSPDVDMHSELIDVISAFSRLGRGWKEDPTVDGFRRALPTPSSVVISSGPKSTNERVKAGLRNGKTVREIWLRDAYNLRSQFGHGHVSGPRYRPAWSDREHLLHAATVFPLYVKALLQETGYYTFTSRDSVLNRSFDSLALLTPFEEEQADQNPWQETIDRVMLDDLAKKWEREFARRKQEGEHSHVEESNETTISLEDLEGVGSDPE